MPTIRVSADMLAFAEPTDLARCRAISIGSSIHDQELITSVKSKSSENRTLSDRNVFLCYSVQELESSILDQRGIPAASKIPAQRPGNEGGTRFESTRQAVNRSEESQDTSNPFINFHDEFVANITVAREKDVSRTEIPQRDVDFSRSLEERLGVQLNDDRSFEILYPSNEFLLQNVSRSMAEKVQVIETNDAPIAYFFGDRHEIYTFSGTLMDTSNFPWKRRFIDAYREFMRGSKCVENGTTVFLSYKDDTIEGYILSASLSESTSMYGSLQFSFQMLIRKQRHVTDLRLLEEGNIESSNNRALVVVDGVARSIRDLLQEEFFLSPGTSASGSIDE